MRAEIDDPAASLRTRRPRCPIRTSLGTAQGPDRPVQRASEGSLSQGVQQRLQGIRRRRKPGVCGCSCCGKKAKAPERPPLAIHQAGCSAHADLRNRSLAHPVFRSPPAVRRTCAFRRKTRMRGGGIRVTAGFTTGSPSRTARASTPGPTARSPPCFPVFSKPIVNLKGMGLGTRVLCVAERLRPALHGGAHVDVAPVGPARELRRGSCRREATVVAPRHGPSGRRRDVRLLDGPRERRARARGLARSLDRDASCRLHGDGQSRDRRRLDHREFICAQPISGRICTGADGSMRSSTSIRAANGCSPTATAATATASCCSTGPMCAGDIRRRGRSRTSGRFPDVSSVQITFHEDRDPPLHAMPPGGFRLAIVNCWNLDVGLAARNRLRMYFMRAREAQSVEAETTGRVPHLATFGRLAPAEARAREPAVRWPDDATGRARRNIAPSRRNSEPQRQDRRARRLPARSSRRRRSRPPSPICRARRDRGEAASAMRSLRDASSAVRRGVASTLTIADVDAALAHIASIAAAPAQRASAPASSRSCSHAQPTRNATSSCGSCWASCARARSNR